MDEEPTDSVESRYTRDEYLAFFRSYRDSEIPLLLRRMGTSGDIALKVAILEFLNVLVVRVYLLERDGEIPSKDSHIGPFLGEINSLHRRNIDLGRAMRLAQVLSIRVIELLEGADSNNEKL